MKVVITNQPRILRESLAMALAAWGEIDVIAGAADAAAILRAVQQHKPDCLILSLEVKDSNPRICRAVFNLCPRTLVLAIGPKTLTVYWFDVIVRSARKECSLHSILNLLRSKPTEQAVGDIPTAADSPTDKDRPTARDISAIAPPEREHVCV